MANSLTLLAEYNSDSESDDEISEPRASIKRYLKDDDIFNKSLKHTERLPVPAVIQNPKCVDDNAKEQKQDVDGRIRSFAHERGNWSTYVYIPFREKDVIEDLVMGIIATARSSNLLILHPCNDFHISLTKTVIIRHHWIDSFTKTISENVSHLNRFTLFFENLKVYCNEERTRTFIGLQIKSGYDSLLSIITILNKCLKEFNLPEFYENPSFHMSLVWCVGDYEDILNTIIESLNNLAFEFMTNNPQMYMHVNHLVCKTGNKLFDFNLCI